MTKKGYQNLTLNQLVDWADTLDEAIKEYFKQKEESK